jgi:hypothetical protein
MDRLGHSTIKVTYDRYGHLLDGHDDELLRRLGARWDAATEDAGSRTASVMTATRPKTRAKRGRRRESVVPYVSHARRSTGLGNDESPGPHCC